MNIIFPNSIYILVQMQIHAPLRSIFFSLLLGTRNIYNKYYLSNFSFFPLLLSLIFMVMLFCSHFLLFFYNFFFYFCFKIRLYFIFIFKTLYMQGWSEKKIIIWVFFIFFTLFYVLIYIQKKNVVFFSIIGVFSSFCLLFVFIFCPYFQF
jgi:hypothetical protein